MALRELVREVYRRYMSDAAGRLWRRRLWRLGAEYAALRAVRMANDAALRKGRK